MASQKPSPQKGVQRIWSAFFYSLDGLKFALFNEAAFRQELCLLVVAIVMLSFWQIPFLCKCVLFISTANIVVVEIVNSAIEAVVDMVSPEFHVLAKHAKDLGSAAVLVSIVISAILWAYTLFSYY